MMIIIFTFVGPSALVRKKTFTFNDSAKFELIDELDEVEGEKGRKEVETEEVEEEEGTDVEKHGNKYFSVLSFFTVFFS